MTADRRIGPEDDAVSRARKTQETPKIKRFYKTVSVAETNTGFCVQLDGRQIRTPAKAPQIIPSRALAEMVSKEWQNQETLIDPNAMPVTRLVNSAIDDVSTNREKIIADVSRYAESDLLCYRAERPVELIDLQAAHWDSILDWVREDLNAPFEVASGVMHVPQSASSLKIVRQAVENMDDFTLSSLASMTNLLGSVLLSLAVTHDRIDARAAWAAAHVDEDWQGREWGQDIEALERRAKRWIEMDAAARVASVCGQ